MDWAHIASALGNLISSGGLGVAGICALVMAMSRAHRSAALPPVVAMLCGVGLLALALDEGLELHDRLGRWLWDEHQIEAGPVNHVDDLFLIGYLAVGFAVFALSLPTLLRSRRFVSWLSMAGAALVVSTIVDAFGEPGSWHAAPEEGFETLGGVVLAVAFAQEAFARTPLALSARSARTVATDDLAEFEPTVQT